MGWIAAKSKPKTGPKFIGNCPDCAVEPGNIHYSGCDVEQCSECRGQWIGCGCKSHNPEYVPWTGYWPGTVECFELGWFIQWDGPEMYPGQCDPSPDLNRWAMYVHQIPK